jgi:molybdopterin synthase catalytic subunit
MRFALTRDRIDGAALRAQLAHPHAGAVVCFEGLVRDHADGRDVEGLDYEVYEALAAKEGSRIVAEALARFPVTSALCVHRAGTLALEDCAVWVGVAAAHRAAAFDACRYIIDEVKTRVPIWKRERYADGPAAWVECVACARHDHGKAPA